jgi:hypothetical protein
VVAFSISLPGGTGNVDLLQVYRDQLEVSPDKK